MQLGIGVLVGLAAGLLVAVLGLRLFMGRRLRAARGVAGPRGLAGS